jgi:T4-like virus Myoviridae tail sheath stabiliser
MLSNQYFYFSLIRKYINLFGATFNDLIIQRNDKTTGAVTQIINVPIQYAEHEKMLTRVLADPNIDRKDSVLLPRLSFFMDGFTYANERKIASNQKYVIQQPQNQLGFQFAEVPWDFHFSLWIYVKNNEDATKILEQIVPFFSPTYTVRAFLIPNRPAVDIPITLKEITHLDTQTENFKDRDILIWELHFTLKAAFYCPISKAAIIDVSTIEFFAGEGPNEVTINNHAFGINNNILILDSTQDGLTLDLSVNTYLTVNGVIANTSTLPPNNYVSNTDWAVLTTINPGGSS